VYEPGRLPWSARSVVSSRVSGPALAVVRRDRLHSTPTSGAVLHSELVDGRMVASYY